MLLKSFPANKIILIIILLFSTIIYLKTSSLNFVNWDDDENIRTNIRYKEMRFDNVKYHYQNTRYKALAMWSFMVDNHLWGEKIWMYHMHNVILHLINTILVFFCIKKITKRETLALITAVLFSLHPAFVEPVAWVTGRKDLLFVLLTLLSCISYLKYTSKNYNILWFVAATIFIYLASLAKIQAFTIPLLLLGLDWYCKRKISAELILEKIILFFLISDVWLFFVLLFFLYLFLKLAKPYLLKKIDNFPVYLFWYLLIISFFVFGFFSRFIDKENKWLIIPIISVIIYAVLCFFVLKNKSKLITKLSETSITKKVLLLLAPLVILLLEFSFQTIINRDFWSSYQFNFWGIKQGSEYFFSLPERFILAPISLLYYVLRFFVITPQNPMVPYPERTADGNLPSGLIITGIIVFVVMLIFVFLLFRYYKRNRTVAFGAIWFIISISVVMHIIPIEGRVLAADRYAYPAYIGLFLMMACFADFLLQKLNKKLMIFIFLSIILILSITTFMNIDTWKNSKTLWTKALDINPKNHYAMYSLGLAYFTDDKKPEKAVEYLDKAIALKENFQYYNNRGRFKFVLNDIKGSLKDINKSIELDSNSYAAYNNRGAIQQKFGNFKGALDDFNKALKLKPNFTEASNNRSKVLRLLALDSLINNNVPISSEQKPEIIEFIKRTSDIYIINKDFEKASQLLQKGINIDPYYSVFHEMLAVMYQVNNDFGKALNAYNQGLLYMPSEASLLIGRALLYLEKGDTIKACHDLKFADKRQYPEAASLSKQLCGE